MYDASEAARTWNGSRELPDESQSLSQEHFLIESLRRLENTAQDRLAVRLHLSKLRAENRKPYHIRIAADFLRPLVEKHQGQTFLLSNSDIVAILRGAPRADLDDTVDRLRYLFADDPLAEGDPSEEAGKFSSCYSIDNEFRSILLVAERLYARARERLTEASKTKPKTGGELRPLEAGHLGQLMGAINSADLSPLLRRQPIAVVVPGAAPKPVLWEVLADLDELGRQLIPGIDLAANRWYRYAIREAVLDRLLVWLSHSGYKASSDPLSIDATVAGLMSDQFLAFDRNLADSAKKRMVFELQEIDVFSDLGATLFVRDMMQDRGYRLCLDGLNHMTLPMIDRPKLGMDFLKFRWGPDFELDTGSARGRALTAAVDQAGAARVILYGADTARAIESGRGLGVTLFQGGYVDSLLRTAGPAAAAGARPAARARPASGKRKSRAG